LLIGTEFGRPAFGQKPALDSIATSACWRFAFGEWVPSLDWAKSGHVGDSSRAASNLVRLRDSLYGRDSVAAHSRAMRWERTSRGLMLYLTPEWWPAGVQIAFDSASAGGKELFGTAYAVVSNLSRDPPRSVARAAQVTCTPRSNRDDANSLGRRH
jgi:hypothetical protein